MAIPCYVKEQKDYLIELRRHFHKYPEISLREYKTALKIEEELDKIKIPHKRIGETGVVAILENLVNSESAKTIVLRADIDALPIKEISNASYKSQNEGVMHACGHDAHTACLLGAAKILKNKINKINGKIIFIFQMAEEIGSGANKFIEAGYLNNVYRVLGIHMASYLPVGTIGIRSGESNASCDYFKITVKGKSSHVSKPHLGIDALYIASQIVCSLQSIVSRSINPLESAVVGIGKMESGTNYNIIANKAVLEGTTRSFNEATRSDVNNKVISLSKQIAESYGASAEIEFKDYASPLINDFEVSKEIYDISTKIVSHKNVLTDINKNLAADDFAEFLKMAKGQFVFIGSKGGKESSYAHHHESFDIHDDALLVGTSLYVEYVISKLS